MKFFSAPSVTINGNTANPATLRTLPDGRRVADVTVATTPGTKDNGVWKDKGVSQFYTATFWDDDAELVAKTFTQKGLSVILMGDLVINEYESKKNPGTIGRSYNLENALIAPRLNRRQTVNVALNAQQAGGYQQAAQGQYQQGAGGYQNQGQYQQAGGYQQEQPQPNYNEQWGAPVGEDAPPF